MIGNTIFPNVLTCLNPFHLGLGLLANFKAPNLYCKRAPNDQYDVQIAILPSWDHWLQFQGAGACLSCFSTTHSYFFLLKATWRSRGPYSSQVIKCDSYFLYNLGIWIRGSDPKKFHFDFDIKLIISL